MKRIYELLFILFVVLPLFICGDAHASEFILYLNGGVAKIPMKEWTDFSSSISYSEYRKDNFAVTYSCELECTINPHHSILLDLSYLTYHSDLYCTLVWTDEVGQPIGNSTDHTHYHFSSYPIQMGYKVNPTLKIPCYFSIKLGYYFSKLQTEYSPIYDNFGILDDFIGSVERTGRGYGASLHTGLQSTITRDLLMCVEISYRYANGMGFTDDPQAIKIEFSGFYFNVKFGYKF